MDSNFDRYLTETQPFRDDMAARILAAKPDLGKDVATVMADQIDSFALLPFHGDDSEVQHLRDILSVLN